MKKFPYFPIAASLAVSVATFANAQHYTQVNLVSNRLGKAPVTDKFLVNPWGMSRAAGSPWWVADNGSGFSSLYGGAGTVIPLDVSIPRSNPTTGPFIARKVLRDEARFRPSYVTSGILEALGVPQPNAV